MLANGCFRHNTHKHVLLAPGKIYVAIVQLSCKPKDMAAYPFDWGENGYAFEDGLSLQGLTIENEFRTIGPAHEAEWNDCCDELGSGCANDASIGDAVLPINTDEKDDLGATDIVANKHEHCELQWISSRNCDWLWSARVGCGVGGYVPPPPGLYSDAGRTEEGVVLYISGCTLIFDGFVNNMNHSRNQHEVSATVHTLLPCANVDCLKMCFLSDMKCCSFCRRWECTTCAFWCTRCRFKTVCCHYHWQNEHKGEVQLWCKKHQKRKGKGIYECLRCYRESYYK